MANQNKQNQGGGGGGQMGNNAGNDPGKGGSHSWLEATISCVSHQCLS